MPKGTNIDLGLTGYAELFMDDASRAEAKLPRIHEIPLDQIDDFPDHPFKVKLDEDICCKGREIECYFLEKANCCHIL